MTLTKAFPFGTMEFGQFRGMADPPIEEPEPPAPFRAMAPKYDPFSSDHYLQMPVGTGMTYVSTGNAKHTALVGMVPNLNYNNWTDPYYTVTSSDPTCSAIEHHEYLQSGWNTLTNAQAAPSGSTPGPLIKKYTGNLRVPTNATWQSTSNTDRKVILNFDYEVTLTTTIYAADGVTVVGTPTTKVYPAGTLQIETQKWQRVTGSTVIWTTNLSKQNVVTGENRYREGAVANKSAVIGYVRAWEMALAIAGDKYAIKHGLKVGISDAMLALGYLHPANSQDGNAATAYKGTIPYGTHVVLPMSYDIEAMQPSAPNYAKAFLYALQLFGAWVMIRSGSNNVMSFGVEPRGAGAALTTTQKNAIIAALTAAIPYLRISSNSNLVVGTGPGTFDETTREPNVPTPHGGGTAVTLGLGLTDMDPVTGWKLPINTNPATWVG